jgi:hypothetical protein
LGIHALEIVQAKIEMDHVPWATIQGQPAVNGSYSFGGARAILHALAVLMHGAYHFEIRAQDLLHCLGVTDGDRVP